MSEKKNRVVESIFAIRTVTMHFNPMEDRIVMDSSDQTGSVQRLWFSKRILDKLIPTLTDQLEVYSSQKIPTELEQSLAQKKAEIDKKQLESVKIKSQNPSWLVTSVQVGRNENKFQLVFLGENTNEKASIRNQAKFNLAVANLRQWLNAIYKIYLKAEWETKAFPRWLNEKGPKSNESILLN